MSSNINVQALTNAKAKLVKSLAQSKFRKKHQSFFVEGRKMVLEAILNKNVSKQFIVVKEVPKTDSVIGTFFLGIGFLL